MLIFHTVFYTTFEKSQEKNILEKKLGKLL